MDNLAAYGVEHAGTASKGLNEPRGSPESEGRYHAQKQQSLRLAQGLPPEVRAQPLSQKGSVVFPREARGPKSQSSLLRVAYSRLAILKGAAQQCSARIEVGVKCSQLEIRHFGKSGKADFMFCFSKSG